jgi:demethylmenaquinone methyltransferase/2-methoxy-6-polyprenyl-1,4-benzoquinol methylase
MTNLLDRREPRVRRMFDGIAPKYDLLNHLLSLNADKSWRRRVTRLAPLNAGPLLDVCTGTGDLALEYDRATGGTVPIVGVDFSGKMLAHALSKAARREPKPRIQFIQADAQQLPFPSNTFELVAVAFGLRNITDTDRGLAEMTRVARPGGRVAVLEFSRPRHWLLGRAYRIYFRYLLPFIGQMFSRSADKAYVYLPASVMEFPDGEALASRMRAAGLRNITMSSFACGIATLYVGNKESRTE